jgi:hypothetical protein
MKTYFRVISVATLSLLAVPAAHAGVYVQGSIFAPAPVYAAPPPPAYVVAPPPAYVVAPPPVYYYYGRPYYDRHHYYDWHYWHDRHRW